MTPSPHDLSLRAVVAIGLLGSTLDSGVGERRWRRWRPSLALCAQPDLPIDRLELIIQPTDRALADQIIEDVALIAPHTEVVLHPLAMRDPWDFEEVYAVLHDFARRYPFDEDSERYLLHITTGTHVAQICSFLLAESRHIPAKLLQTAPPPRGVDPERDGMHGRYTIIDLDLSRYDQIFARFAQEQREAISFLKGGIETRSERFNRLIEHIERVAIASTDPILITGPTGAGKTQLATRIADLKRARRQIEGPLVHVNCATLRGDGAMSALFGHVRGAYTGAVSDRQGLLRAADGGVLFLDEIGELGLDEQAMLLRAIESGRFMPVGSDREVQSAFGLIAGTNQPLTERVERGLFREDLLARIDLWTFELPGLWERREDIAPNLDVEFDRFTERTGARVGINREARARYLAFAMSAEARWSRSFRDLSASVTRMATMARPGRVSVDAVNEEIARLRRTWARTGAAPRAHHVAQGVLDELLGQGWTERIDRFDRAQLEEVVRACLEARSLSEAGRALFAHSRAQKTSTNDADRLRKYLSRFDLDFSALHDASSAN